MPKCLDQLFLRGRLDATVCRLEDPAMHIDFSDGLGEHVPGVEPRGGVDECVPQICWRPDRLEVQRILEYRYNERSPPSFLAMCRCPEYPGHYVLP